MYPCGGRFAAVAVIVAGIAIYLYYFIIETNGKSYRHGQRQRKK